MNICKYCGVNFVSLGYGVKNAHKQRFCSKSCSNKAEPRRKMTNKCVNCDKLIGAGYSYCDNCKENTNLQKNKRGGVRIKKNYDIIENQTLGGLIDENTKDHLKYAKIRVCARRKCKSIIEYNHKCQVCDYDKFVELHHIKSISKFNKNTLIKEINDLNNLVLLCPNHHMEVEKGITKLPLDLNLEKLVARTGVEPAQ